MTNYEKKRKRQSGRQSGGQSERERIYQKGIFEGQSQVIRRMIDAGILPKVSYDTEEERKEVK